MSEWTCEVLTLLDRFTVGEMLEKRLDNVVMLNSTQSPAEAMRVLLDHEIQSAPIVDEEDQPPLGFLDIRRLLGRVMKDHDVLHQTDGTVMRSLARQSPWRPVKLSSPVSSAAASLGTGVHRVPVCDETGKVVGIISQIDMVGFLYKHIDDLPSGGNSAAVLDATVMQCSVGSSPVTSALHDMTVRNAFALLGAKKIAALPIVNSSHMLVGKVSAFDVERFLLGDATPEQLQLNIVDFLKSFHSDDMIPDHASDNLVTDESSTVRDCLLKMARARRHHIFVVGAGTQMPLRVVSVGDLVRALTKHNDWKLAELRALSFYDAEVDEQGAQKSTVVG